MLFGRRCLALWAPTAFFAVSAAAAAQVAAPVITDAAGPTAIEQALIEHSCSAVTAATPAGTDPYKECLSSRLVSLRDDYGRDLGRLSSSERRALDAACNTRASVGREAYLACLRGQLVSLNDRWSRANRAILVVPPLPDQSATALPVSLVAPSGQTASPVSSLWLGVGFLTVVVAGGGAFLALKSRRVVVRRCRVCATAVPGSGDLCPACRHEAAEALRHAAIERANLERAQEQEQRALKALAAEEKKEKEKDARRRLEEDGRRQEEDALRRRKEEEEVRERHRTAAALGGPGGSERENEVFDPYVVLGVSRDANIEAIDAAYQEARLKYSPDHVAHLGAELQAHYRRKAEAVDRAYLMLIG